MVDHFLTFINLLFAWMLHFPVWVQNKGKVWSEYYNQVGIYQKSVCIPLGTMAKQLK